MSTQPKSNRPFRVLTLDGGGMRGLYTATVLHTLMKRYLPNSQEADRDVGRGFDLIVGTSTGGILASALASGISTQKILEFYSKHGGEIFPDPMPSGGMAYYKWVFRNRSRPSSNQEKLKKLLADIFEGETIGSMYARRKIGLCIPTVNLSTNKAWVFKTAHNPSKHRDDLYSLVDVCLATSAAPIFFPVISLKNPDSGIGEDAFVDGGLWANNPVLVGLVEALELIDGRPIEIVSIGTCPPPSGQIVTPKDPGRGILQWKAGVKILETSIDAQASGHNFIAGFLAQKLTRLGAECLLIRIPHNPPSSEQIKLLGLDKSSPQAIGVFSNLGKADGESAHGWSLSGDTKEKACVKDIFSSLPAL